MVTGYQNVYHFVSTTLPKRYIIFVAKLNIWVSNAKARETILYGNEFFFLNKIIFQVQHREGHRRVY